MSRARRASTTRRLHSLLAGSFNREHPSFDGLRKIDERELLFSKQVVFAALIDNADQVVLGGLHIGQDSVHLAPNERRFVTAVLQAQSKLPCYSSHDWSTYVLILKSRLPTPCASYQCSSTRRNFPLGSRIVAMPFRLRHRARP